eukprot:TRINITY_DN5719_c0_g1_i2.p2 TRINITY_DN5719_c0_g1~~TRINITY_DN5719_c0_g1_i2.p2  ORF type:complete len:174 (+),score=33.42 TRINITY_DN5719_c0_g1_i2:571-1092(+)
MTSTHRLAAAFMCLFLSAAEQASALGPTSVEFKNYTNEVVTVYLAARTGNGADGVPTREINGPYVVKPGETQSMFKAEGGDLEHVLVCVICEGHPQWNPPKSTSMVLSKSDLDQRADGMIFVKPQDNSGAEDFMTGMKFTNKILPEAMLKGEEFRFVNTGHKGKGTKVIHYNR